MINKELEYYEGNDVTFRGAFEIDNVAQTPDSGSALLQIMERTRRAATLSEVVANISGTQFYYKVSNLVKGVYRIFLTATFNSGADERTGIIDYIVRKRVAR